MIDTMEGRDSYLASFARFEESATGSKSWLRSLRNAAIARFSELGFPTTRNEEWRHTSVAPITRIPFRPARKQANGFTAADLSRYTFGREECAQLVFVNGHFSDELSSLSSLPRGVRVKSLAAATDTDRSLIEPHLARHAGFDTDAFTALNTAFMTDGAFIHIPPAVVLDRILHMVFISTAQKEPSVSYPRNLVVVGNGSQASIVESYFSLEPGVYFTNVVTEIVAGNSSVVDFYKIQRENEEAFHMDTVHVVQERDSSFSSHSISLGGSIVLLNGEGADCTLNGLYVTKGRQHVDNHTTIDHARAHCSSRELYKGILDDRSTAAFNGGILVRQDAQKTNAKQTNKNLLLSREALVNTKPELKIFADDVKCTHGATIGQLDEEAMFYLRSRGIDQASARVLLTYAFATDLLATMRIKPLQCQIDLVLLTRLSRGHESLIGAGDASRVEGIQ